MKKKKSTRNKYLFLTIFVSLIIIITFLMISSYFYYTIYIPAKLSVEAACSLQSQEALRDINNNYTIEEINAALKNKGINITIAAAYDPVQNRIILSNVSTVRDLKHEFCHKVQWIENRYYLCDNIKGRLRNEVECYIRERL